MLGVEDNYLFFEGSEKKATILIDQNQLSLLENFDDDFWQQLVQCGDAHILSSIKNSDCKAFLLSESSLFIWHDRLLIITCGNTQLVRSVEYFIQQVGMNKIQQVIYQRKNEYFAHAQPSTFGDDIKLLSQYMQGKAHRFGELDSHHNYIFHQDNRFQARNNDKTYELLAYQISKKASDKLTTVGLTAKEIRAFLQLETLFSDFILDDFVFEPFGYSINAINGLNYLTIHVTPQESSSYVSIESNVNLIKLAPTFLAILSPKSFDLLSFNEFNFSELTDTFIPKNYVATSLVSQHLSNNYSVCFSNYILPQQVFSQAATLDLVEQSHAL
jgi:S-adenosylmethionine decarboxylase